MDGMNIMMWAGLCVLVAYNGSAELATLGVMLLTIAWAANKTWCRVDVDRIGDAAQAAHVRSTSRAAVAGR